jgi:hypothetical protein
MLRRQGRLCAAVVHHSVDVHRPVAGLLYLFDVLAVAATGYRC